MHPIIYDVAVSLDGFISGPDGDISGFAHEGEVVEEYIARLADYAVAIMGRTTYEFGYRFGMTPGQNPYAHMQTIVFSRTLVLPGKSDVQLEKSRDIAFFEDLKASASGPIYLCGGGAFAGSLLSMGLIDTLRLKRAPILLGTGVGVFGSAGISAEIRHIATRDYGSGYVLQEFSVSR